MKDHVHVLATFVAKKDRFDELLKNLHILVQRVQAEPGCIKYDCYQDLDDPLRFTFIEEWSSAEALSVHAAADNLKWWNQVAADLREPAVDVRKLKLA